MLQAQLLNLGKFFEIVYFRFLTKNRFSGYLRFSTKKSQNIVSHCSKKRFLNYTVYIANVANIATFMQMIVTLNSLKKLLEYSSCLRQTIPSIATITLIDR